MTKNILMSGPGEHILSFPLDHEGSYFWYLLSVRIREHYLYCGPFGRNPSLVV